MKFLCWALPTVLAGALLPESSTNEYTVVKLEEHPEHRLLLKPNAVGQGGLDEICKGATTGYTGYLVSGTKHFYLAYFDSRSNPAKDPLVLWTNGGPGCSSMIGALQEHGPCLIAKDGKSTVKNDKSWINTANVIYFEQPLGVGFSFNADGKYPSNSTFLAGSDLVVMMKLWYRHFPNHKAQDFHLSGESYAGHYLPIFANSIVNHNAVSQEADQIPLKSVIIGNGQYDFAVQEVTSFNMTCTDANGIGPLLDKKDCDKLESVVPKCVDLYQQCQVSHNFDQCMAALDFCTPVFTTAHDKTKRSVYDVRQHCAPTGPCDNFSSIPETFLNLPQVRAAFGAIDPAVKTWHTCNDTINVGFWYTLDPFYPSAPYIGRLLDRGIRFLIYHGIFDMSCNYIGAEQVLADLNWHGKKGFNTAFNHPIKWSGGEYWEYGDFRYSRVNGAGHFVPTNQPAAALELLQAWLEQRPLK